MERIMFQVEVTAPARFLQGKIDAIKGTVIHGSQNRAASRNKYWLQDEPDCIL